MLAYVIPLCLVIIGVALVLTMARLIIGPDLPDRILALDTLYINAIAMLVLLGIWLGSDLYFEAALLIAVMGFIGTVAVAKYLLRGDIIEGGASDGFLDRSTGGAVSADRQPIRLDRCDWFVPSAGLFYAPARPDQSQHLGRGRDGDRFADLLQLSR